MKAEVPLASFPHWAGHESNDTFFYNTKNSVEGFCKNLLKPGNIYYI